MLIIQMLGQARSGKDWTASELKKAFEAQGKSVELMSYAAPMKRIAASLFNISLEQLEDFKNKSDEVSIEIYNNFSENSSFVLETNFRIFLQRLGSDAIKPEFGNAVWANLIKSQIEQSNADIGILTDCRFTTEIETFPEAVTLRVINEDLPPPMDHPSETELLDYEATHILNNTGKRFTPDIISNLAQLILKEYYDS